MLMRAGDCLKYGLTFELSVKNCSDYGPMHFQAFLVYYTLLGYVDDKAFRGIVNTFKEYKTGNLTTNELHRKVLEVLVPRLSRFFKFGNSKEMFDTLNENEVPDWVYESMNAVARFLPNAYLMNDYIYYVATINEKNYFKCAHWKNVMNMPFSEFTGVLCNNSYSNHTISERYNTILDVDRAKKIIYLSFPGSDRVYAEYHVDTGLEVICNAKFLGTVVDDDNNICPVIIKNRQIEAIIDGTTKFLEKVNPLYNYRIEEDKINVETADKAHSYVKPYAITVSGERIERTYTEYAKALIGDILRDICIGKRLRPRIDNDISVSEINDDTVISIGYLNTFFEKHSDLNRIIIRMYRRLLDLLKNYFSEDEDLLDLLYMLVDASCEINDEYVNPNKIHPITPRLILNLTELHNEGKLQSVIRNINECKSLILENALCESGNEKADLFSDDEPLVGVFELHGNRLAYIGSGLENGVIRGDHIMTNPFINSEKKSKYHGAVLFNYCNGEYVVQYNRALSDIEKRAVVMDFHIRAPKRFVVTEA